MVLQPLKVSLLLVLMIHIPQTTIFAQSISVADKTKITTGLAAGKVLADALKDGKFQDSLTKLGTKLGPFLGALGPMVGIALIFIPTGDSVELKFMKNAFKEVNNKLDILSSEFEEVKNAIDWSAVVVSYGAYERKIRAAEANLNRIYEVEGQARESEQKNFINTYESDFDNSLQKLYDAIMNNDHVFSKNILEAAVKQTKNAKRKVEQFSLGLVQLLVQAIKVKISYYGAKKWAYDHVTTHWTTKMNSVKDRLQRLSDEVKEQWHSQLKTDADDIILRHHGLGNQGLMQTLYNFVTAKYDWRYWFIAVYDDMHGFDNHAVAVCGGYSLLHQHGKNIIIASQDNGYASNFKESDATSLLQAVEQGIDNCDMKDPGDRAHALVNNVAGRVGNSCATYALRMAVKSASGLWYISWGSHRAFRSIGKRKRCCWQEGWWNSRRCKDTSWHHNMIVFG